MSAIPDIWSCCLDIIRDEMGSRVVETWFKAVSMVRWDSREGIVYLCAPNTFVRDWICNNYQQVLQTHLCRLLHVNQIKLVLDIPQKAEIVTDSVRTEPIITASAIIPAVVHKDKTEVVVGNGVMAGGGSHRSSMYINRAYSFESFVVGPTNSLSYAAAQAITEKPGMLYNPLFIYGGSGLGKTHLLHAIGNEMRSKQPHAVVLYQPADRFVNEFIHAIRFDKVHKFQLKYQSVDVLLFDDIHFISNKEQTQEAFFHIFNTLYSAHKQIVFSSDTVPNNMNGIAERLRSRLACGLVTDIHMPRLETKIAILKKKAELSNSELADDIAHFVASRSVSNIRELEGALIRVLAFAALTHQPVSLELAQKVLAYVETEKAISIDFERIVRVLYKYYPYDLAVLCEKNRSKQIVIARQIAMYFMKKLTDKSLRDVGHFLGGRNHATVMHALAKIEEQMQVDKHFRMHLESIESSIKTHV